MGMLPIVDPAEAEFRQLRERADALRRELATTTDRKDRRAVKRRLRRERLRISWEIARIRWRNRSTPW